MPDFSAAALRQYASDALDRDPSILTTDTPAGTSETSSRSHGAIHGLLAALGGADAADVYTTKRALDSGAGHEANGVYGKDPSLERLITTKAAVGVPSALLLDHLYNSHPKLALSLAGLMTAATAGIAAHNATVHK